MASCDYDDLSVWQDVLDEVMNGHIDGLECPFCGKKAIEVDTEGFSISVKCTECGHWIEGQNAY